MFSSGDPAIAREILKLYLDDVPVQLVRLRQALSAGSARDIERTAHLLKGASASVAADRLREGAVRLELAARAGDLEEAAEMLLVIDDEFSELHRATPHLTFMREPI